MSQVLGNGHLKSSISAFLRFITTDTAVHFHRAHFVDAVVEHHLPKDIAHFGKRLTSYSQSGQLGPITLQFADGSSANCDLLVGCDGIKSVVRHAMMEKKVVEGLPDFSKYMEPVWTGSIAYRVLVPVDRLPNFIREDPQLTKPLTVSPNVYRASQIYERGSPTVLRQR